MSLQSFEIENQQALSEVKCSRVPQLMVIAGPNGVGKSTLLHQLHGRIQRFRPSQGSRRNPQNIECDGATQSVYFSPHRVPGNNSQFNRGELLGGRKIRYRNLLSGDANFPNSRRNFPSQRNPSGPDATAFRGLGRRMAEFTEQKRSLAFEKINEGESVSEDDLPDVEQPLRDLIDRVVPGISLIGVVERNDNYQLKFRNRMGEEIELENLSSGEIDIITMLFFVAEQQIEARLREYSEDDPASEDDTVVLIDGPESYLHPYLQLQFIDFLDEYIENRPDIQIILVTHSEVILNQTPDENLWYLVYPDMASGNQLQPAKEIELNLLENILGEIGTSAIAAGNPLL